MESNKHLWIPVISLTVCVLLEKTRQRQQRGSVEEDTAADEEFIGQCIMAFKTKQRGSAQTERVRLEAQ